MLLHLDRLTAGLHTPVEDRLFVPRRLPLDGASGQRECSEPWQPSGRVLRALRGCH